MQFDYIAVGHVTVDVLEDGSRRPGGTVLYAALQAARLGLRALILTRGVADEIEAMLSPWASELELRVQPADKTTTLATSGHGPQRTQRLLAWAGPIEAQDELACPILHLAPVAQELPERWPRGGRLLGLTPQGLARTLPEPGGIVRPSQPQGPGLAQAERADVVVISREEREVCGALLERAQAAGAMVAVTAGARAGTILVPGAPAIELPVNPVEQPADDLGAGDVFAAALFTALAEGRSPAQAGALANTAAALRMSGVGAEAIAGRSEIESMLERGR